MKATLHDHILKIYRLTVQLDYHQLIRTSAKGVKRESHRDVQDLGMGGLPSRRLRVPAKVDEIQLDTVCLHISCLRSIHILGSSMYPRVSYQCY